MGTIYVKNSHIAQFANLPYNNENITSDNLMLSEVMKNFRKENIFYKGWKCP